MPGLFTEKQWWGEFFFPENYEKRFSGKVEYSPEKGVILSYTITGHNVPPESDVVHGVLSTGEKCTLIGRFLPEQSGMAFKNGLQTRQGKASFLCLLIGDHAAHDELFFEINFSLTNMQEFFFPKGYKDFEKYSQNPLFCLQTDYGKLEVGNEASFGFLHNDITAHIYSHNEQALKDLKECFDAVEAKHPDASFLFKKDIAYRVSLNFDAGVSIRSAFHHIDDISNLFALLIYSPTYPENIRINKKADDDHIFTIDVYPTMALSERTIGLCNKDRSHFQMPIKKSNIDLAAILKTWLNNHRDYPTIVSSIQNETGFTDMHSLYGELVLYATQLEFISFEAGKGNVERYEYPLETFGCGKIKGGIGKLLAAAGELDIGKGIGDLRNEIAHVGKPKRLLQKLSMRDMMNISQYMQITIIGYILAKLGIDKAIINDYQIKFTPGT